jgi:hypothetical protein
VKFEYDPEKSERNRRKHGIDFDAAKQLWSDDDDIEIPARTKDERRSLIIGKIGTKHWSAVVTYRGSSIRLISVRRARRTEVELYEGG